MEQTIKIYMESTGWIDAIINMQKNPITTNKIINALPFKSKTQLWGDEVYFEIPVHMTEENACIEVEDGDLAFWPAGNCMCIFFGRTPASRADKPAAASPVNVFGRITGDLSLLKNVKSGEKITVQPT